MYFSDLNVTEGLRNSLKFTLAVCFSFSYLKYSISYLNCLWNLFSDEEIIFRRDWDFKFDFFLLSPFFPGQHSPVPPFRMRSPGMALDSSWRCIINKDQIWTMQILYLWLSLLLLHHALRLSCDMLKKRLQMCIFKNIQDSEILMAITILFKLMGTYRN